MTTKSIFIIDDDKFYTNILEEKLSNIGDFKIKKFHSGQACIDNVHEQPDIIFLDHLLGDTTGFEVLKEIKSTYPDIHIVILSGQKEMKVAIESLRYGATDYLLKNNDDHKNKLTQIIKDCELISTARATIKKKNKIGFFTLFSL